MDRFPATFRWLFGAALVALLTAGGITGCATTRAVGDAVDRIITGDESPEIKVKRALAAAYSTHANATRTVRQLFAVGDIDVKQAAKAYSALVDIKQGLDYARTLIALGDLTQGQDELTRAQSLLGAILAALPKGDA